MSELKEQLIDIVDVLQNYDLDVNQTDDGYYELVAKDGEVIVREIRDSNELHSVLLGYEEGYKAAVKFYKVVRY